MFTPVYLDHNATTPLAPSVREAMLPWLGGRFGNAGRNIVEGPGYVIANFGVNKTIGMERWGQILLGASFQNIFNHVNYGQPNMTVNNAAGGVITSTHIFPPAGSSRTGQLTLRWRF